MAITLICGIVGTACLLGAFVLGVIGIVVCITAIFTPAVDHHKIPVGTKPIRS